MFEDERPKQPISAPRGVDRACATWDAEAAKRMLMNNLDPSVALDWKNLVVYGGSGRAARNWRCYRQLVTALESLGPDETLCVQSGKPVYVSRTFPEAPRVIIANSNLVPQWATQDEFDRLDALGLMMYGQMTAGSWIYIGTQGILQGTYETLASLAQQEFDADSLAGRFILTAGMGGMSGAQPLAGTMNDAAILVVEVRADRIARKVKEGYCDRMSADLDEALKWIDKARSAGRGLSVGLVGNAAEVFATLAKRGVVPDVVTDQTSAHDLLDYVPVGDLDELDTLRTDNPDEYKRRSIETIMCHVQSILDLQAQGAICFDYGNNLRGQAEAGGLTVRDDEGHFLYPGFVPAYIRPLFCDGKGPFRWACLSGDPADLKVLDDELLRVFPDDPVLQRWVRIARERVPQLGLPSRICWLGYGDRAVFGAAMNRLIADGKLSAPIAIGRDHLDCGSVASPNRETEAMRDGSDAVADWPLLNFGMNAISGASWVSFHHGGGVGMGYSLHAGMVIVADGTDARAERLDRVLTVDPGMGVARHADAGYVEAIDTAVRHGVKLPSVDLESC
ncbi:MAG: urocanate hydratase [Acidobacteria bacterium]|nr:urocanate hydratase [Acidobacteriota bacterium]MDP6687343.1 urocanate hydratase [Acidobacteriota bacterium]|tara:strand:+ start:148 stop:1839 length:1692 start_codon:yes stop_codon:yes gene_type:complete